MPTLSSGFERVNLIDLRTQQAREVCEALDLTNVYINTADIAEFDFEPESFDAIVAADVLEHFRELDLPVPKLRRWLRDGGYLFTSLPTETLFYRALRLVFRKQKPPDHYHSAAKVERELRLAGFQKRMALYHPLLIPFLPLYRISAWQKVSAGEQKVSVGEI